MRSAQAICRYRKQEGIDGPLFIGIDTHALSLPALESALEVLAANGVEIMISKGGEYTPTPAVSHAILVHNRGRKSHLADGIVVTPSHNPPDSGGFKYNPPNGGPADTDVTGWIEKAANALLDERPKGDRAHAGRAGAPRRHAPTSTTISTPTSRDLANVIDLDVIKARACALGVDPLGGAGVHYWARIAERYGIDLTVVSEEVDPTFSFMTRDWDGRIRMDPSSPYAMQRLIGLKDRFDIAFGCDTDHDRHGIVTRERGAAAAEPLPGGRDRLSLPQSPALAGRRARWARPWSAARMIDRVAARLGAQAL